VILLDAYALVAFLGDEPAAAEVEQLLTSGEAGIITPNLIEAAYVLAREHGIDPTETRAALASLPASALAIVPLGEGAAWRAAELRLAHYHARTRPLSLADCSILGAAAHADSIATADPDILHVAAEESITALPLPQRGY
jgi:predicted nucleic acid-binding protein